MDISIVIVNYNVRYFLHKCLESVFDSRLDGLKIEVFVVDNNSVDGSVEMVRDNFPQVNLIASKENLGFSKGNNLAIKQAAGRYILLLNPDTIIEEDTLRICTAYMDAHEAVGALGVQMIDGTGKFLAESKRALPGIWNSLSKLSGMAQLFPDSAFFNGYALGHLSKDERHEIEVLCGAFMFMRAEAIEKVGMLDEAFFMYGEDIDLSRRILEGGYKIHYIPDTKIIHYKGESTKKTSFNYVRTFYNAMKIYVRKHYKGITGRIIALLLTVGINIRAGLSLVMRFLQNLIPGAVDAALIYAGLLGFGQYWGRYYHNDPDYLDQTVFYTNIAGYAILWALVLYFVGYYKKRTWRKRIQGIVIGLGIILSMYALLPESYRSSRIVLLMGSIIALLISALTAFLFKRQRKQSKKILAIANKKEAEKIKHNLDKNNYSYAYLGTISPGNEAHNDSYYLNTIDALDEVVHVLKADEVIFHSEDMPMKDIMEIMIRLGSRVRFKITGDENLSIIGSNSKDTSAELYTLDVKYNLAEDYQQHVKRSMDVLMGLLTLVGSPILMLFNRFRLGAVIKHAIQVLLGIKTMVGYAGIEENYRNLPLLKPAVITLDVEKNRKLRDINLQYAKEYTVWQDLEIFFTHLNKLAS